jgi:predicted phage tail protein
MPQQSINALDRRVQSTNNDSINNSIQSSTEQNILVTDIISEGPISGLVNGTRSVFLNNDPIDGSHDQVYSNNATKVQLAATSTEAQVLTNGAVFDAKGDGTKFILVQKLATMKVTISNYQAGFPGGAVPGGQWDGVPESATFTVVSGDPLVSAFNMSGNDGGEIVDGKTLIQLTLASGEVISSGSWSGISVANQTAGWEGGQVGYKTFTAADINGSTQHEILVSRFFKIEEIEGNTITLATAPGVTGTFPFTITNDSLVTVDALGQRSSAQKYNNSAVAFAPGTLDQDAMGTLEGIGTSSVSLNVANASLEKFTGSNYTTITSTGAQAAQIDEVKIIMAYPSGCFLTSVHSGTKYKAGVAYHIELAVHTGGSLVYNTVAPPTGNGLSSAVFDSNGDGVLDTACWGVVYKKTAKFATEFIISLENLQPFNGFTIRISRITKHDPQDYTHEVRFQPNTQNDNPTTRNGGIDGNFKSGKGNAARENDPEQGKHLSGNYSSNVSQAIGLVKERLNFPYTAYANTSFSSKTFQSQPTRGYECRGLLIEVPSNYITREETGDLSAKYTRINETGNVGSMNTPQLWDGTFRPFPVYTDNPAWVFYDICTNNRYGLGDYLLSTDIDKFSLYKVAKYCDELVPDGKGGTEPRFRSNIYITKATDAYKILKDFATVFRGMLFWSNSQFTAVLDEPKEPIYTFSRSNVIDGSFEYQSTGSKTRANQIVVSWNNPEAEYKLEPIIIEDRENQIKTGTVKSDKAVAFGCTSEGQAIRYGRWKLWTSINQTELVSFKTGINAAFLGPGDIINVHDEADFRVPFSGRVHACTASTITLDREVSSHLASGFTYTIAVIIPKRTVVLNQESATLANTGGGTTTFNRGDQVTTATIGGATTTILHATDETTQKNIVSAVDTSTRSVSLQLVEETIVEERVLNIGSKSTSEGRDTIAFTGGAFSVATDTFKGSVWAIKQASADGSRTINSYKEYKIMGINEAGPTEYDITAVEHYNTKFDLVDRDFTLATPDPLYPRESTLTDVPSPLNLRVLRNSIDTSPGEELTVEWDNPLAQGTSGVSPDYEHLGEYEIEHNFGTDVVGLASGSKVGHTESERSQSFTNITDGSYIIYVTTISGKGRRSPKAQFNITVDDIYEENGPHGRLGGIVKGGASTVDLAPPVNAGITKGLVSFAAKSYIAAPFGRLQQAKQNTIADPDSYSVSCTALAGGAPVAITGVTKANPVVVTTSGAHGFSVDTPVIISGTQGMTQLNGSYYITATSSTSFSLYTLVGAASVVTPVNSTAFGTWTSGGVIKGIWPSNASGYVMIDFSKVTVASPNANALKLVARKLDTTTYGSSIDYWYDATKYLSNVNSIWTSVGNVAVTKGTSQVLGSGFNNLKIPEVVTIGTAFAGKIALIVSDTVMYLDRPWPAASATGQSLKKQELDIDYEEDFLLAPISYDPAGAGTYKLGGTHAVMTFLDITPNLNSVARDVAVRSTTSLLSYNAAGSQSTTYSTISLDITALGYQNAEFNITGAGFSQTNQTADSSTTYTPAVSGSLNKVVHSSNAAISYSTTNLVFTVKAREALDPDNTDKQRTTTYTIGKIKEGGTGPTGSTGSQGPQGPTGAEGDDGNGIEYIFAITADESTAPSTPSNAWGFDAPVNSTGWFDGAPAITITNKALWRAQRAVEGVPSVGAAVSANWTSPSVVGRYGDKGEDGAGIEYIFQVTTNASTAPSTPSNAWGFDAPVSPWFDAAPNLTSSLRALWRAQRAVVGVPSAGTTVPANWTSPSLAGTFGEEGDVGKRSIQGYLYYEKSSLPATPPAAPSSGLHPYAFGTGRVSGTGIFDYAGSGSGGLDVWSNIPRPQVVTSDNIHYTVRYYGEEATAAASTITNVTFSAVVRFTTFNGVVQFENGTGRFKVDGNLAYDTTQIDGGSIRTGMLHSLGTTVANSAIGSSQTGTDVSGSAFTTNGMYINLGNGALASKHFRITASGDATFKGKLKIEGQTAIDLSTTAGATTYLALMGQQAPIQSVTVGGSSATISNGVLSLAANTGDTWSNTTVAAGWIGLNTTGVTSGATSGQPTSNTILLSTIGGNNRISIFDGTVERVRIGKL